MTRLCALMGLMLAFSSGEALAKQREKIGVSVYGEIKLNAAYDSNAGSPGAYVTEVPENAEVQGGHFLMTANESWFGVKMRAPTVRGATPRAWLEVDLFGAGGDEYGGGHAPQLRLRQAYGTITWTQSGFELLAGQAWDLVGQARPSDLSYGYLWRSGNLGTWRPQVRITKRFKIMKDTNIKLAVAGLDASDEGVAELPAVQGRFSFEMVGDRNLDIGVGMHYARPRRDRDLDGAGDTQDQAWALVFDAEVPIGRFLAVEGEFSIGENTAPLYGLAGIDTQAIGGWWGVAAGPFKSWVFSTGFGMESVQSYDDLEIGDVGKNMTFYLNGLAEVTPMVKMGLGSSFLRTVRKVDRENHTEDVSNWRHQAVFIFLF